MSNENDTNADYVIYNADGRILRTVNCPISCADMQVQEGEFMLQATADCAKDAVDPQTHTVIPNGNPEYLQPTVQTQVTVAPTDSLSTQTQLDLLWQAMDAGTFPKAEPFYSAIKAQKDAAA